MMQQEAESASFKVHEQLINNKKIIEELSYILKSRSINKVITIARGSSDCVASYINFLFMNELGWISASIPPSLSTVYDKNIGDEKTLAICVSQSGGSPDLRLALENSKKAGCLTLALVNEVNSPLAKSADFVLDIHAGSEKAVAATKSVICSMSAILNLVAVYKDNKSLMDSLIKLPNQLEKIITLGIAEEAIELLKRHKSMFVIGRGYGYPIAQEMSLKLKETCGIHAESFSSAEVLHGPFALMNQSFATLIISQNDLTIESTKSVADRIVDLGVDTVSISTDNDIKSGVCIHTNVQTNPIIEPVLFLQYFYLLVNKLSLRLGYNPDIPSNLKKVTETL